MTNDAIEACLLLQARVARYETRDHWLTEQAEEALSEIVRHPDRQGNAHHLARNALLNARKKLGRRQGLAGRYIRSIDWAAERSESEPGFTTVEVADLVARQPIADRALLSLVMEGKEADEIGSMLDVPVDRTRERLSRARSRARSALQEAA